MKWVTTILDVNQLMLFEGVEQSFSQLLDSFRHDRDMYGSVKGATFENKAAGIRATIQNGLQPLADKLMEQFTANFIEKEGETLKACYDHLPSMQEDERLKAQGKLYLVQALDILLSNGTISHEQVAKLSEVEMDGTGETTSLVNVPNDSLGKIPLALQQLALARERANTAGDTELSNTLGQTMDRLIEQMVTEINTNE